MIVALAILIGCRQNRSAIESGAQSPTSGRPDANSMELPIAGTQIPLLPAGDARQLAQEHCLACHSADMLRQQRLTGPQWQAEVDKMQRWGAEIRDEDKNALAQYLLTHFGPDNDRFKPIVASP